MGDHGIVIISLTALAFVLLGAMGPAMHSGRVVPNKKRFPFRVALVDEFEGVFGYLFIDRFHALAGESTGIFDLLPTLSIRPAVEYASRPEPLLEFRVLRIVCVFRLLFGIEVVEISKELIEPVHCWQEFVFISKMVFAELAGGVT